MKVERIEPKPVFRPVVLTLETQEEVDKLYAMFNYNAITEALGIDTLGSRWWKKLNPFTSCGRNKFHQQLVNNIMRR